MFRRFLLYGVVCAVTASFLPGCAGLPGTGNKKPAEISKKNVLFNEKSTVEEIMVIADSAYQRGDLESAETAYLAVLDRQPEQALALYRLGNIAFKEAGYEKAMRYFKRSLAVNPRDSKAHYNLSVTYLTLAERHLKYYAATVPADVDVINVTEMLKDIHNFAEYSGAKRKKTDVQTDDAELDSLAGELERAD